ncbi:rhoptry-associated membrane antigen, putative [Plasmodium ovale]|uniref:Rhoptry-associated membrane antigen, putative n=1 Tax=Plasmodium ovale TaxID=36330 RepID=A0A1C3KMB2_PLAOA|nr:rhoptry-associated membrane antigen, putative [Plasmodium ovale]
MNILLLSFFLVQNIVTYFEHFKNGVIPQYMKDKIKYVYENRIQKFEDLKEETSQECSHHRSRILDKYDLKRYESLFNVYKDVKPFISYNKNNEFVERINNSLQFIATNRLSRKLMDDVLDYDDDDFLEEKDDFDEDDKDSESFLEKEEKDEKDDFDDDSDEESFLEKDEKDDLDDDSDEESFLEKDEKDDLDDDADYDNDAESFLEKDEKDDFDDDDDYDYDEESFLEKDEKDDLDDNEKDEFDDYSESFLETDENDDMKDNLKDDEFDDDEYNAESFLEKDDNADDADTEDNGKEYKDEYENKMNDSDYPDEYVGLDDNEQNKNKGNTMNNVANKDKESFLEKNANDHLKDDKHSTFVSSYLDDEADDKYNNKIYDEDSFLEQDSYSHSDADEDDSFDDDFEDSFLERGKIGTENDDFEDDLDKLDAMGYGNEDEENDDVFDNHHLNEMTTSKDVHSFIQKDMEYIDELMEDGETIKEAVKKGPMMTKKPMAQKYKPPVYEEHEDNDILAGEENGFIGEEEMISPKSNPAKNKPTLRNGQKTNNMKNTTAHGKVKNMKELENKENDITNEELFNDEASSEVIADSFEEGANLDEVENKNMGEDLEEKLTDQGINENTLLNDNNTIYNAKFIPHKKREHFISPHTHHETATKKKKNNKHNSENMEAYDQEVTAEELIELEGHDDAGNPVILETEEVDVGKDSNGSKSSSSVSLLSSLVFLLFGFLYLMN